MLNICLLYTGGHGKVTLGIEFDRNSNDDTYTVVP